MITVLAWRNLWRNSRRTLITAAALSLAYVLMTLFSGLMSGMTKQMRESITELTVGDVQIHAQEYLEDFSFYRSIPRAPELVASLQEQGISAAARLYGFGLISNERSEKAAGVQMSGIDLEAECQVTTLHEAKNLTRGSFLTHSLGRADRSRQHPSAATDNLKRAEQKLFAHDIDVESFLERYDRRQEAADGHGSALIAEATEPIVLGKKLAKQLDANLGDTLVVLTTGSDGSIGVMRFQVQGVLKNVSEAFDRTRGLISSTAFRKLYSVPTSVAHEIALRLPDGGDPSIDRSTIDGLVMEHGPEPLEVRSWRKILPTVADMIAMTTVSTGILTIIIYMAAGLVVLNSLLMMIFERIREFGILQALGFGAGSLFRLVMTETLYLTAVALAVGMGVAALGNYYLVDQGLNLTTFAPNGFDFSGTTVEPIMRSLWSWTVFVRPTILLVVMTMVSALYPAWRVSRMVPVEAIYSR